jgi:hypothetical protein
MFRWLWRKLWTRMQRDAYMRAFNCGTTAGRNVWQWQGDTRKAKYNRSSHQGEKTAAFSGSFLTLPHSATAKAKESNKIQQFLSYFKWRKSRAWHEWDATPYLNEVTKLWIPIITTSLDQQIYSEVASTKPLCHLSRQKWTYNNMQF